MANSVTLATFMAVSSLLMLIFMLVNGRRGRLDTRLDDLLGNGKSELASDSVGQLARTALPKMGTALLPSDEEERSRLKARLIQAGLYNRQALLVFLGVKMLLMVAPACLGLLAGLMGLIDWTYGLIGGACFGVVGMIGPSFWLDRRKKSRQTSFRRALPDALDVLVLCLEGGLSLPGALRRVALELRTAHPVLATELNIVQREIQLGRSAGEALRQFADRSDLEEIRSLSSLIIQAERYGASLVKSLRIHAEMLRQKRLQYAEEMAQKAATKVLFPTIFCIFPGIFIIILGPAAIQILETFDKMGH
jgi:tight adherence protein C